jgi:hypothetical protein
MITCIFDSSILIDCLPGRRQDSAACVTAAIKTPP